MLAIIEYVMACTLRRIHFLINVYTVYVYIYIFMHANMCRYTYMIFIIQPVGVYTYLYISSPVSKVLINLPAMTGGY